MGDGLSHRPVSDETVATLISLDGFNDLSESTQKFAISSMNTNRQKEGDDYLESNLLMLL